MSLRILEGRIATVVLFAALGAAMPASSHAQTIAASRTEPPQVKQSRRFLAQRGLAPGQLRGSPSARPRRAVANPQSAGTSAWQPVGPTAVISQSYGLVTGRISALALDPSDSGGNKLYIGATGGGVWFSQNAAAAGASAVEFIPLTDSIGALSGVLPASISIGALTVQPGGTGVILAGTGDPNDALDSYYGAGILRSVDCGKSWSLISATEDATPGGSGQKFGFYGEGFAGFAWSTADPELVVAAVSQAFEATLVNAEIPPSSYEGLYYSSDSGATWNLATITDGNGALVQGPTAAFALPDGNAATSVVWNPVRKLFVAAVRFHGYYQSTDGITWTRMAAQPGVNLTTELCPPNAGATGSTGCPIFRGSLAVNPQTGDTFAWTVDDFNQDQGLWQDQCSISGGRCSSGNITFAQQLNTSPLETNTIDGPATIENGDYNLALAAVPFEQDTYVLAGGNDLWKCSLAGGCAWRNTTNATTCMSAQVGEYQHALAWNAANPLEIFVGNDSGIWRSIDAIDESGPVCNSADASHFENLNGGLGSLAEVVSLSQSGANQFTMMAGLGANGTAGVKSTRQVSDWPEVEGGEGGPVAIDFSNAANWYVNNQAGVSIHLCSQAAGCTPSAFGLNPAVNDADVGGDGLTMTTPAPFLVDRVDPSQLLIGTCRVWRGPANGGGWSAGNAISPILDGSESPACEGDPLIRSLAALQTTGGNEAIYAGMYGSLDGGSTLPGHIFGAVLEPGSSSAPVWQDLTENPVTNDTVSMNAFGFDISSIFIDPHDLTGNTVYVTVEGFFSQTEPVRQIYRSVDGGAHWANATSNLLPFPANSVVVDPEDANTVYVATDAGVYSTRQIASCATDSSNCWTAFGTGLPESPVVALLASPLTSSAHLLTAATYGRGIWQNPLWTAAVPLTTATVRPASLTFASQRSGTESGAKPVTLTNTGSVALTATITIGGDFSETDNCQAAAIKAGSSCILEVSFTPSATGTRTGTMTIGANVPGGQILVPLSGTGTPAAAVNLTPASLDFGEVIVGTTSAALEVTANNTGSTAISISGVSASAPFQIASNVCGSSLAGSSSCQLKVTFSPTAPGAAGGKLSMTDSAGTQSVQLSGDGGSRATDTLSTTSLTLPPTVIGQLSAAQNVTLTNSGDEPLTAIAAGVSGEFQLVSNCGTSLPGRSSCAFSVKFAPTAAGGQSGLLTITDAIRKQTVKLAATGELPAKFAVAPSSLNFAPIQVGASGAAMTLTVTNTGGSPMANVSFHLAGESAASFLVSSTTCGALLDVAASCKAQMKFVPTQTGGNQAILAVSSSTVGVAAAEVPLSGVGLPPPELSVAPTQLVFDNVVVGTRSAAKPVMISNAGGAAMTDMRLATTGDFALSAGTCASKLAVGANCTAQVAFQPASTGTLSGTLTVFSASGAAAAATVILTGTATGPATIVTSSGELDFGPVPAGSASSAQTLTVSDAGTASLDGLSIAVNGAFRLERNQCSATLRANNSCSVEVEFLPVVSGAQTGTLTVSSITKWASPAVVQLTGTGAAEPLLAASPAQLTFGSVAVGKAGVPLNLKVSNIGSGQVEGLSLKAAGDFATANNGCAKTLAANSECTTDVVFSPTAPGTRTGSITVAGTSSGLKPVKVALSGNGLAQGSLSVNVSNLVFAMTTVGASSNPQLATVTNTSQGTASGLQYKTTGDFGIEDNTCGSALPTGASCTMDIFFAPRAVGLLTGSMTASSSTAQVEKAEVALSGAAVPSAYLVATPERLNFPGTTVGSPSSPLYVTLRNPGIAAAGGLKAQTTGDFSATLCAATLPAGASCQLKVVFNPSGAGVRAGQVTVTTTAAGAQPLVVPFEGVGTAPASIVLDPSALRFAATVPGQTSAPQTITVSNPGAAMLNAPKIAVSGDFEIASTTCGGSLAAGGACKVRLDFAPSGAGGRAGTLTVTSSTAGVQPAIASLTGIGLTPTVIAVSPAQLSFPVVLTGQSSPPKTVTIANAGGTAISSLNLAVSQQFALTENTCTSLLSPGKTCAVEVYFKPVAQGAVTGGLTITSPSASVPASVALSGTGGAPAAIGLDPGVVPFPTTGVGLASSPMKVTIANQRSAASLKGLALKIGTGFRLVNNTCKDVLGPSASCSTGIEFVPSSAGVQQANLAVTAAGGVGGTVTLQGTGFDFTVSLNGTESRTVASGQTASYDLSIQPLSGATGSFSFACGTLPANTQCAFSPPSVNVAAGVTGYASVLIETGQGGASSSSSQSPSPGIPFRWRALGVALGIAMLPFALRGRRHLLATALLLAVLAGMTSCLSASGGGSGSQQHPSEPGVTPPATYSIPIKVLADGVEHSVTVSLTVD